jgi:Co/Zn/Cd efflux system component
MVALLLNGAMFGVEFVGGMVARSLSLFADSMDFLSDAVNYAITLMVLGLSARAKARAALFKGLSLGGVGLWVAGNLAWTLGHGTVPHAEIMGGVGLAALAVNAGVALALYRWRHGDANMESIWLCSRNDALGNCAVLLAASGVWATDSYWPDLSVAVVLAWLPLSAAVKIVRRSLAELRAA